MTEEEKKAIEQLEKDIKHPLYCGGITIVDIEHLQTVLNLLDKKDKELETAQQETQQVLDDYQDLGKEYYQVCCELELADRVIHLMAKEWKQDDIRSVEEIIEYFYKKVEEQ